MCTLLGGRDKAAATNKGARLSLFCCVGSFFVRAFVDLWRAGDANTQVRCMPITASVRMHLAAVALALPGAWHAKSKKPPEIK